MVCTLGALATLVAWSAGALAQPPQPAQSPVYVVQDVIIHNNRRMPTEHVLNYLRTRPGTNYDVNTVGEDVHRLYETRQFSKVEYSVEKDKPTAGACIVHVSVIELPSTIQMIEYRGKNHAKDDDLEIATGVKRGSPMNPYMNKLACQGIERYYREKGRAFPPVQLPQGGPSPA